MTDTSTEWGVRTTSTPTGTALPVTRIHRCSNQPQADGLLSYYTNLYASRPRLDGRAELVTRTVTTWEAADHG